MPLKMNTLVVLAFCIQACLVQNVFGQCLGGAAITPAAAVAPLGVTGLGYVYGAELSYPGIGYGPFGYGAEIATPLGAIAPYGGVGEGNVAVAGELPVAGTTAVPGQVPIMGAVRFGGDVPTGGAVSITGQCACGFGSPYGY